MTGDGKVEMSHGKPAGAWAVWTWHPDGVRWKRYGSYVRHSFAMGRARRLGKSMWGVVVRHMLAGPPAWWTKPKKGVIQR